MEKDLENFVRIEEDDWHKKRYKVLTFTRYASSAWVVDGNLTLSQAKIIANAFVKIGYKIHQGGF